MFTKPSVHLKLPLFECESFALQRIADDLSLTPIEAARFLLRGEAARRGIPLSLPRVGEFSRPSRLSESITPNLQRAVAGAIRDMLVNDPESKTLLFKFLLPEVNRRLADGECLSGPSFLARRLRLLGFHTRARTKRPFHNFGEVLIDSRAREIVERILSEAPKVENRMEAL